MTKLHICQNCHEHDYIHREYHIVYFCRRNSDTFHEGTRWGRKDYITNGPIVWNKDFLPPQNCLYILEHAIV